MADRDSARITCLLYTIEITQWVRYLRHSAKLKSLDYPTPSHVLPLVSLSNSKQDAFEC